MGVLGPDSTGEMAACVSEHVWSVGRVGRAGTPAVCKVPGKGLLHLQRAALGPSSPQRAAELPPATTVRLISALGLLVVFCRALALDRAKASRCLQIQGKLWRFPASWGSVASHGHGAVKLSVTLQKPPRHILASASRSTCTHIRLLCFLPVAFQELCPYGHGAIPGPGDTREGKV